MLRGFRGQGVVRRGGRVLKVLRELGVQEHKTVLKGFCGGLGLRVYSCNESVVCLGWNLPGKPLFVDLIFPPASHVSSESICEMWDTLMPTSLLQMLLTRLYALDFKLSFPILVIRSKHLSFKGEM